MSKKIFTDKEIELLSKNSYVKAVSSKGITYTDHFKETLLRNMKEANCQEKYLRTVVLM